MSDTNDNVLLVEYGEFKVGRFADLPFASQLALVTSGVNHKFGNEVASAVTSKIKTAIRGDDTKREVSKDEVTAFRAANGPQVEAWTKQLREELVAELIAGTVGTGGARGPRGPKLDEFAALVRDITQDEIGEVLVGKQILDKNKAGEYVLAGTAKRPTGKDVLVTIGGEGKTMPQLVDMRLANANHRSRIEAEARKRIEAKRRSLEKALAQGGDDIEAALG